MVLVWCFLWWHHTYYYFYLMWASCLLHLMIVFIVIIGYNNVTCDIKLHKRILKLKHLKSLQESLPSIQQSSLQTQKLQNNVNTGSMQPMHELILLDELNGAIPFLGELKASRLNSNVLHYSIPSCIFNLIEVDLSYNKLNCSILLTNSSRLQILKLNLNQLHVSSNIRNYLSL